MKRKRLYIYCATLISLSAVLFCCWKDRIKTLLPGLYMEGESDSVSGLRHETEAIARAIIEHFKLFGTYPKGNNSTISKALAGDNPDKFKLLKNPRIGKDGAFLDTWGTPYEIQISEDGQLRICSAGANLAMGDADDRVYSYPLIAPTNSPSYSGLVGKGDSP